MNRVSRKFRLPKDNVVHGLEGGAKDLRYWRGFLAAASDLSREKTMLIDARVVDAVENHLQSRIDYAQQQVYNAIAGGMTGARVGMLGNQGIWGVRYPRTPLQHLDVDLDGIAERLVWDPDWYKKRRMNEIQGLPEPSRYHWVAGDVSYETISLRGRSKMLVGLPYGYETGEAWTEKSSPHPTWRSTGNALIRFLCSLEDDGLMQLWFEFPSWRQLQRELVRRAGNFFPSESLKQEIELRSLVRKVQNSELRRALMGVFNVIKPEPIAVDAQGKLYHLDDDTNLLEVVCPSTGRMYHLGVPKIDLATLRGHGVRRHQEGDDIQLDTPTKARRWTMGIDARDVILTES